MNGGNGKPKKRIIVDLDIVTVAFWDKKGDNVNLANRHLERVREREFFIITPFFLLELIGKWKYSVLKDLIEKFYLEFSNEMIRNEQLDEKIDSKGVDDAKIITELLALNVKREDALLVLVASLYQVDFLVTFNRVHLKNKKETINEVLRRNGLETVKIAGPEEV